MRIQSADRRKPPGAKYFRQLRGAASNAGLSLTLLLNVCRKRLRERQCTPHQGWRPAKMAGSFSNRLGFAIHVYNFPDGDSMAENLCFAPTCGVPKADSGKLFLEGLFLQVKAA